MIIILMVLSLFDLKQARKVGIVLVPQRFSISAFMDGKPDSALPSECP